jgi:hypothetical protein
MQCFELGSALDMRIRSIVRNVKTGTRTAFSLFYYAEKIKSLKYEENFNL